MNFIFNGYCHNQINSQHLHTIYIFTKPPKQYRIESDKPPTQYFIGSPINLCIHAEYNILTAKMALRCDSKDK